MQQDSRLYLFPEYLAMGLGFVLGGLGPILQGVILWLNNQFHSKFMFVVLNGQLG